MEEPDRRLTAQLLHQWQESCGVALPPLGLFKQTAAMGLWPNCMLVQVEHEPKRAYKCEHMGVGIGKAYGRDLTNTYLPSSEAEFPGAVLFGRLDDVAVSLRPIENAGEFKNAAGKLLKYRACFLPYSEDTKNLTHILVALSFREF